MASTNKTSNLNLSQFISTDTPTWLVDYNGDMEKIDAGVARVEELAETASTQAVGVASGLQTTNQTVTTLSGQVANVQNQANTTTASVNGINQRLGNADISGIGDGTITGAISMQNGNLSKEWTLVSSVTTLSAVNSGNGITIPNLSSYKELLILTSLSYFETTEIHPIINGHINSTGYDRPGCYVGPSDWQTCKIYISDEEINVVEYIKNGTSQTSGFTVQFYVR